MYFYRHPLGAKAIRNDVSSEIAVEEEDRLIRRRS